MFCSISSFSVFQFWPFIYPFAKHHSHDEKSSLQYSFHFERNSSQFQISNSRSVTLKQLTLDQTQELNHYFPLCYWWFPFLGIFPERVTSYFSTYKLPSDWAFWSTIVLIHATPAASVIYIGSEQAAHIKKVV